MRLRKQTFGDATTLAELASRVEERERSTAAVLNGGLRVEDQSILRTISWDGTAVMVDTGMLDPPIAVRCLSARESGVAATRTGDPVTWVWGPNGLRIDDIDNLTSGTRYEVRIEIVQG